MRAPDCHFAEGGVDFQKPDAAFRVRADGAAEPVRNKCAVHARLHAGRDIAGVLHARIKPVDPPRIRTGNAPDLEPVCPDWQWRILQVDVLPADEVLRIAAC